MNKPISLVILAACGLVSVASVGVAQDAAHQPHPVSEYGGVHAGSGQAPPVAARAGRVRGRRGRQALVVTWPGFEMTASGSRFFLQTTTPITPTMSSSEGRIELRLPNAAVHLSNSSRWLETQYFNTPVVRARLERRGRDLVFVLHTRAAVTPTVSSAAGENGYAYTYIDFPAGNYATAVTPPRAPAQRDSSGRAEVRSASPSSAALFPTDEGEDEAPPRAAP